MIKTFNILLDLEKEKTIPANIEFLPEKKDKILHKIEIFDQKTNKFCSEKFIKKIQEKNRYLILNFEYKADAENALNKKIEKTFQDQK